MSNQSKLAPYLPLAAFLSAVCGDNFEVILHDVSEPEASVVAIFNGLLSGRKVGVPMTELARSLVREEVYRERDFVSNYEGRTRDGKQFVSSTYFIKEGGELLGLICVNHDLTDLTALSGHLQNLLAAFSVPGQAAAQAAYTEDLDDSIPGLSTTLIHNTVLRRGIPAGRMTAREKEELIGALDRQGVFSTKGAVGQEKRGVYHYRPLVSRAGLGDYKTRTLIEKLYDGRARDLVAALVERRQLDREDVAELKDLFDRLWEERREDA